MPRSGTPAPPNTKKKPCKIITDLSNITQNEEEETDVTEFDLGTKIKTPKEVMLEELSLMKGKGSKMFRMRQQRVDKFIISAENLQNLQNLAPPIDCEKIPPETLPKPSPPKVEPETENEKKNCEYVKTYVSPWEHAMKDNDELKATMKPQMPGPYVYKDLPQYKSFNRTALPFGGFDKASHLLTFEIPELKAASEEPEQLPVFQCHIDSRPSFNRTPIGWVCSEEPSYIPLTTLEPIPFEPETEDL
ncbi:myozenin-1b [Ictalurus furcatus]|uniref:myozenin-1b n=1 Tax=Ictalurus furcatus TaxID=66913 RepID=UPI0023505357|nr:myozenin-1b [Ictalurus furcatus]XP_053496617.1 myozenin-1b [Ictalurus furcatus]